MLTLMSRLLAPRGVAALDDGDGLCVVAAKGGVSVSAGDRLEAAPPEASALVLPLRHGGEAVGLVALGPRLSGEPYTPAEVGVARSLAGATAASVRAGRSAYALAAAVRRQEARAQELRTLFEASQAFGRALDREAILNRLGFALMGQLLVARFAVALCDTGGDDGHDGAAPLAVSFSRGAEGGAGPVPCALADLPAPRPLGESDALHGAGWRWAVPLRAGDVSRGVVLLGPRATGELDADAADFAAALAALAVGALETADRVAERLDRERLDAEVAIARDVQRRLLPEALPAPAGLDVAARWRPSRDVSGDTYELADLGGGRLLVAVADVVGKGIGAALLMATLQAGFRLLRPDLEAPGASLAAATARLDRLVAESTRPHQFVTLAWGVVEPAPPRPDGDDRGTNGAGWRFRYVVAGHPPPRVVRAGGAVEALDVGGPLLGVLDRPAFTEGEAFLGPGDAVLLYTDGATEAQDGAGDEIGPEGLDGLLATAGGADAIGLLDAVAAGLDAWAAGGAAEDDDLTLVAVRVEGKG